MKKFIGWAILICIPFGMIFVEVSRALPGYTWEVIIVSLVVYIVSAVLTAAVMLLVIAFVWYFLSD